MKRADASSAISTSSAKVKRPVHDPHGPDARLAGGLLAVTQRAGRLHRTGPRSDRRRARACSGAGPGWSRPLRPPLSTPPIRPPPGPLLRLWLGATPLARPSPWPRSSTHDSSSASCLSTFLSASASPSAKLLGRLAKVSPPCACTGAAYVMGREQRDWSAPLGPTGLGVPVRRGVVRCRKKRTAFWQRGIAVPFCRW